jgi:transposase
VGSAPFNRGGNISVIGALDCHGMLTEIMVQGGVDKEVFRIFVKQWLIPELLPGQVVILDNLRVHHDPQIQEAIEAAGASVLFLPPYHPQLDPIENAWSKFKESLRAAAARTYEALVDAVRTATTSISAQDALGWFAHCGYEEPCNNPT